MDEALQTAFRTDGPVLVDVVVAKEELAIPPQIKLEQAKGFSLYMLRAIISGRGDEVIELAKTNWLQVKQKQYVEPDQGKAVIDLRSDTVTRPGRAMLEAMMAARSGTMCMATTLPSMNCSAMPPTRPAKKRRYFYHRHLGQPRWPAQPLPARRRVYRRPGAHNYLYEAGGAAVLGSIQPQPIDAAADGSLPLDKVAAKIKPDDIHFAPPAC